MVLFVWFVSQINHRLSLVPQDAQKGCPARPHANRNRRRTLRRYVEDFDEPRTLLADFFSILLESTHTYA